MCVELFLYI